MVNHRILSFCGVLAPIVFIFTTLLGGALRPGYSLLTETISELFSPGSPNKPLLDSLHTTYALLFTLFGFGVLRFVQRVGKALRTGRTGAVLLIAAGLLSVTTATIFPQDPWGTPPTVPGRLHMQVSGTLALLTVASMVLLGIWFNQVGLFSGFRTYSFITAGASLLGAGLFVALMDGPWMGLGERVAALIGFQWTVTLAWWIFSNGDTAADG